jgi:hypothetical protein
MTLKARLAKLEGRNPSGVCAVIARPRPGEDANTAIERAILEHRVPGKAAVRYIAILPERGRSSPKAA